MPSILVSHDGNNSLKRIASVAIMDQHVFHLSYILSWDFVEKFKDKVKHRQHLHDPSKDSTHVSLLVICIPNTPRLITIQNDSFLMSLHLVRDGKVVHQIIRRWLLTSIKPQESLLQRAGMVLLSNSVRWRTVVNCKFCIS